jgi:hypothetical protein
MSDYETVPTMMVLRNGGEAVINAEDFNSATDKNIGEKAPKAPKPAKPEAPKQEAAPAAKLQLGVQRDGDKFFIIDLNTTEKVTLDGVDEDGYDIDSEAITAAKEAMK